MNETVEESVNNRKGEKKVKFTKTNKKTRQTASSQSDLLNTQTAA